MVLAALDYAGARTAAGDFSSGEVFAMAYNELIDSIRCMNAEPRYSFGYDIAKGIITQPSVYVGKSPYPGDQTGLLTETYEKVYTEASEWLQGENHASPPEENRLSFGVGSSGQPIVPYRIARVFDGSGEYTRSDRSDVIRDRELNRFSSFRQFSWNQDKEDWGILELSAIPSGELTVIAEKQIEEPIDYDDALDLPRNVYKFVFLWLARTLCRKLGNAEILPLAEAELASGEKPFLATNERNKRETRMNPRLAYARLGNG